eukprot:110532_1
MTDDDLKDDIGFSKGHIKKFRRRYKDWCDEQGAKKKAGGGGGDNDNGIDAQQNALLEAQKKTNDASIRRTKTIRSSTKKMLEEQEKKYKQELEKLKKSSSINKWDSKVFVFSSNFDTNGIVYGLATEWGNLSWQNPAISGKVIMRSSGVKNDSKPLSCLVGRDAVRFILTEQAGAWFSIDFLDLRICPTNYSLKHYSSWNIEALRNWIFEGSIDGTKWTTIKRHTADASLKTKSAAHTWSVNCNSTYYFNQFRIRMTGVNDNNHNYLCCSGFEIYGSVKRGSAAINLPIPIPTEEKEE